MCSFEREVPIKTVVTLKAMVDIKIFKQKIYFTDKESGNITIFESSFCDVPGKVDCKYSHGCIEQFEESTWDLIISHP
ncbi:hypothetical protein MXB_4011 [Myxobolus squamalis]|nr:hypothetical protein MXB_4011 [Myxobolus squamalis]